MSDIIFNSKDKVRRRSLIESMESIDDDNGILLSSLSKKESGEKKKKSKRNIAEIVEDVGDSDTTDWLNKLSSFSGDKGKKSKKKKGKFKGFEIEDDVIKKKKGKKRKGKKAGELTDYNTQFAPELSTLHNLQKTQIEFVNNLQKKFDDMDRSKSSARGIGKFTTDLIAQINAGRSTALSITSNMISLKKTIADLTIKEKKEFGSKAEGSEDLSALSSKYLQQMLSAGRPALMASTQYSDPDTYESSYDELEAALNESLGESDRDPIVDKYLEYETKNIKVKVEYHMDSNEWNFAAFDENGNKVKDYPLPDNDTKLSINLSTMTASDEYSRKFDIIKL